MLGLLNSLTLTSLHDYWKNHNFDHTLLLANWCILLFNILSRFVIGFLPRSKCFLISWLQSPSAVILEPKKINSVTASTFSTSIYHELMELDTTIFIFWMLYFKPAFSLFSFTFIKRLYSSSLLSAIRRCIIFVSEVVGCFPQESWFQLVSSSLAFLMMYCAFELNKQGDNMLLKWTSQLFHVWF